MNEETPKQLFAAMRMMEERGCVVIGFHSGCCDVEQGDVIYCFCNLPLPGHELVITRPAKREDWDAQVAAIYKFDGTIKNTRRERGDKYFKCTLRPRVAPLQPPDPAPEPKDDAQA